ncbi:MAG TPA: type I-MYXAN CRISPR-associated protein Cas6/Cmx6 [Gammaproteobacteria bacterium]|nr:type I-MYXAN CRISPR-associated protein Cas6/Cmx6 [Gammaproteobacteria bacterium]
MYWQENHEKEPPVATDEVVDLVFAIDCKCLPVDHAYALSMAVQNVLPWLANEPQAGLHTINVAASGNGWQRPDEPNALLHLSRRTRMELRVPKQRIDDAKGLLGKTLDISGYALTLKSVRERPLSTLTTLFSRHLAANNNVHGEEAVLDWVAAELKQVGIEPRKMLCGTEHVLETPEEEIIVRSLMIAELEVEESLWLQQHGLGPYRHMGCGLFIPHKNINDLSKTAE